MATLIKFTASNFEGECTIDEDFEPYLIEMNEVAKSHNMIVVVTSSGRKDTNVQGAIVIPAKMGNHLVFQAIDCNLKNKITGEYYNSKKMADGKGADLDFCNEVVRATGLRWGMAFKTPDSIHFDSGLNLKHPEIWHKKYKEIQAQLNA